MNQRKTCLIVTVLGLLRLHSANAFASASGGGKKGVDLTKKSWDKLNLWLSELNGYPHVQGVLPQNGVDRTKLLNELQGRFENEDDIALLQYWIECWHDGSVSLDDLANSDQNLDIGLVMNSLKDIYERGALEEDFKSIEVNALRRGFEDYKEEMGYGSDWKTYQNDEGYTHLEELLIYQPLNWRQQAREYLLQYQVDLDSMSSPAKSKRVQSFTLDRGRVVFVRMRTPISVVLFHPEISRRNRYEPLNFLLAYGVQDPLPGIFDELGATEEERATIKKELSPMGYFLDYQQVAERYKLDMLRKIGKDAMFPRMCFINELDFGSIIGQRIAKRIIRQEVVRFIWDRCSGGVRNANKQPLSMIFAGPSGNGKTEMAVWLSALMNRVSDDNFIKIDCGKLSDDKEVFGMSGAYHGSDEGSALNNFVLRKSREPESLGIVLLDEIEKAKKGLIHGLYQVFDRGEWTDKKLEAGSGGHTKTIPCGNLIFILTTNSATELICEHATRSETLYTGSADRVDLDDEETSLEVSIRQKLMRTHPFTDAFIGRIDRIVPFLPMARGGPDDNPLMGESMTIAKMLIEAEQEKMRNDSVATVDQFVDAKTKHTMARLVVMDSIPEAGVRSIQKSIAIKMGNQMKHALLVEKNGIDSGSNVKYSANEELKKVDWSVQSRGDGFEPSKNDATAGEGLDQDE